MGRKEFIFDLEEASQNHYSHIANVSAGEEDGTLIVSYAVDAQKQVTIVVLIPDLSYYPRNHSCVLYTTSEDAPSHINKLLTAIEEVCDGKSVHETLELIQQGLAIPSNVDGSDAMINLYEEDPEETKSAFSEDFIYESGEETDNFFSTVEKHTVIDHCSLIDKLRADLLLCKDAGFKVGNIGTVNCPTICVSIGVSKLGISLEALEAWKVEPKKYFVCLIRYRGKYVPLEALLASDEHHEFVDVRVALCDAYKPRKSEAQRAFKPRHDSGTKGGLAHQASGERLKGSLSSFFINEPLNLLMTERFWRILSSRWQYGLDWSAAETLCSDTRGSKTSSDASDARDHSEGAGGKPSGSASKVLPDFMYADHFEKQRKDLHSASLPLIAMQFALRHFVRCTEFCLVCHCQTNNTFEALKPYVCSKPLCLYQYMALGFGPNLEWELIGHPYVVDLLVSFAYASAAGGQLHEFPNGLSLRVPSVPFMEKRDSSSNLKGQASSATKLQENPGTGLVLNARLSMPELVLRFDLNEHVQIAEQIICLQPRQWIALRNRENAYLIAHVAEISWPRVQLVNPTIIDLDGCYGDPKAFSKSLDQVQVSLWDVEFDNLADADKSVALRFLLDILPNIRQMKEFLLGTRDGRRRMLTDWQDRIPKSALDVLRWIVISNRSCILQDDEIDINPARPNLDGFAADADVSADSTSFDTAMKDTTMTQAGQSSHARVYGMDGYLQFRFAQGAPDKEQRFIDNVRQKQRELNLTYPTIFAWHGSAIENWHSILREGLHFEKLTHGRSFGNGVYMSISVNVAKNYCSSNVAGNWRQSLLKVASAVSLQEVVNAPDCFVSRDPHYVVSQTDWVQTRYLFVKCELSNSHLVYLREKPRAVKQQDPVYAARGEDDMPILIPLGRSDGSNDQNTGKNTAYDKQTGVNSDQSDETDGEDTAFLHAGSGKMEVDQPDDQTEEAAIPPIDSTRTSFQPNASHPESQLTLLKPPPYATSGASKALQRELKETLKVQKVEPQHELGWFLNPELIQSPYQWLVEMHSFDPKLPLTDDLKDAGLTSVLVEFSFSPDHPHAPPFVRVVRPRFRMFSEGGGGHVSYGGAICLELLTASGWSAAISMENVLLQVHMALSDPDPFPARLEGGQGQNGGQVKSYQIEEAAAAYRKVCYTHGWKVPDAFDKVVEWTSAAILKEN